MSCPSEDEVIETPPKTVAGLATFYCTGERNIIRYRAKAAPLEDPVKFREWIGTQASAPEGLLKRLDELLGSEDRDLSGMQDGDWAEFEKQSRTEDPKDAMAKIAKARDFAFFKWERASKTNNKKDQKFYSDILAKMEGTLHDAQLRAKKLGIETGELYSAGEIDRLGRALGYWLMNSTDVLISQMSAALVGASANGPLEREAIRRAIEPLVLGERVMNPLVRASQVNAPIKLPSRLVEAVRAGLAAVAEDGEAEFKRLYEMPVTNLQ